MVKKMFRRIVVYCLTCCVLLATTGTSFYKHFCNMSQQTDISLTELKACCSQADTHADDNDCCELSVEFKKSDLSNLVDFFKLKVKMAHTSFINSVFTKRYRCYKTYFAQAVRPAPDDAAPPLSGRQILARKQTLII